MKILVVGSTGLLGATLVPFLKGKNYKVFTNEPKDSSARIDFCNKNASFKLMCDVMPEVIINLAALTNVDECERNPKDSYLVNVRIVENIVAWIKEKSPNCFLVQLSSDQVYDGGGPHEESEVILSNYYGFSKYTAELSASTVNSAILRTNFFGMSKCRGRESLTDWIFRSVTNKVPITVYENIYFSPLSLDSMTENLGIVIEKRIPGLFNMGSHNGLNKADFAFKFVNALGLSTKNMMRGISTSDLNAYRPKDMRMDSALFEKIFSVKLPTLEQEIEKVAKNYEFKIREII